MRKNKLYTVNRWNRPALRSEGNLFTGGGPITPVTLTVPDFGEQMLKNSLLRADSFKPSITQQLSNFAPKENAVGNPLNFKEAFSKEGLTNGLKAGAGAAISGLAGAVGGLGKSAISGGLSSGAGEGIASIGSTAGTAIGAVNPILGAAVSVGSQLAGGLVNRAFGMSVDQKKLDTANQGIAALGSFTSNAGSFDDVRGPQSQANVGDVYRGGWFSSGKARRKNEELRDQMAEAKSWADRSVLNNISNIMSDQINDGLRNYSAYGGPLDQYSSGMGAVDYGLMSDYLTIKKKQAEQKNNMNNLFAGMPSSLFAFGGDMQTNGADFPSGLMHIDAGSQHELNPNEGVQLGVDNEGTPNLVEENETVWNDYVFSARIPIDQTTKEVFHIGKKREMTYADLSKKLEKEIAERPNDPISKSAFEKQMEMLEEQQERQKQEMEAERAKAAFDALSPEEQTALMQQRAQQEAMAQQTAQEQAIAEQQAMQQPTPEEMAMVQQQQMMQADDSQAALGQSSPSYYNNGTVALAEGGKLYKKGGYLWEDFFKTTNKHSKNRGNNANRYQIDTDYKGNVRDLEASEEYRKFTKYILNDATEDERLNYFRWIDENTGRNNKYLVDGKLRPDWKENYTGARNDGLYGIQHYVPKYAPELLVEAGTGTTPATVENRAPRTYHAMDGDDYDGYIEGELDPKVVGAETRRETLPNGDIVIYHGRAKVDDVKAPAGSSKGSSKDIVPVHRAEWPRYAGLFGPAVGLGLMGAGVGRPNTAQLDAAISGAGNVVTADYKPLGNYLTYRPLDIWYEQNALNAQSRATDRALLNQSSPSRMAGLLANGYNSQLSSGNLFRQAQEYNDNLRKQVAEFNGGTDQFNAEAYNRNSQFNADAYNRARQANAQLRLQAAAQKMDADAGWYNSLYGNVAGLFKGISDLGRENVATNWRNGLVTSGAMGVADEDTLVRAGIAKYKRCKGGKIRRRGLTF